jgi:DNA-directed RNA polymerase subunit RPC12/RpoP
VNPGLSLRVRRIAASLGEGLEIPSWAPGDAPAAAAYLVGGRREVEVNTMVDVLAAQGTRAKPAGTARALARWACALLGHELDNRTLSSGEADPRCARCQEPFLHEDGRLTHTRHVLGCFLRHHTYVPTGAREGHNEYTCLRCGHPLLFEVDGDPYARAAVFAKKVRYLCGLLGHRVHTVGDRQGWTEYACGCGHSFLRAGRGLSRVTHPLRCTASGHRVAFVERRDDYREHRCVDCGHTFGVAALGTGESGARRRAAAADRGVAEGAGGYVRDEDPPELTNIKRRCGVGPDSRAGVARIARVAAAPPEMK